MTPTQNFVIVVAAGKGLRMGADIKKQYICLDGVPVLVRTLQAFDRCGLVSKIILVISPEDLDYCRKNILQAFEYDAAIQLVEGGKSRQDSVFNGLKEVAAQTTAPQETVILIHDGVRPFIDPDTIKACVNTAAEHGACLPAVKVSDTLKSVKKGSKVEMTVDRRQLYCAQTPQAFRLDVIRNAFDHAFETGFVGTDDASLVEHAGGSIMIVEGSKYNIKLTTPEDLVFGEFILLKNNFI